MENPDDTFASTLDGADARRLEKLRRSFAGHHESPDDWDSWRRVVLQAIRSGKSLEERVQKLHERLPSLVKLSTYSGLDARVVQLEEEAGRRRGVWGFLRELGLVVAAAAVGHWLK